MVKIYQGILGCFLVLLPGCAPSTVGGNLSFPSSELPAVAPTPVSGGTNPPAISLVSSMTIGYSTVGVGSGLGADNIVFDGTYFVVPALTATNTITFGIINAGTFAYTTSYQATATGANSLYTAASNGAGTVYVVWRDGSSVKHLSSWPTVNPASPVTSITFDETTYGCSSGAGDFKIAYLSGTFYGACTATNSNLRLFSFDSNGNSLSGVSVAWPTSDGGGVLGLTVLNGNLLVATGYYANASLGKYSTTFQLLSSVTSAIRSLTYYTVKSITTDGSNLFVGNGYEVCGGYAACYRFSKITKGNF